MKGVILAGGTGSRLHPLTRITNKHLLPIYDRPMISYAIEALVKAGVSEMMLVTGGTHAGEFLRLLGVRLLPSESAGVSLVFKLTHSSEKSVEIPRGSRVSVSRTDGRGDPPVFAVSSTVFEVNAR